MITEAIILAGGLGTRLRSAVPDLPKCMAPVAGRPFTAYVIDFLQQQGIQRFIFSLGYRYEVIEEFLERNYRNLNYTSSIEEEPLGTGGAIRLSCGQAQEKNVIVVNGDTFFKIDIASLAEFHGQRHADCTLALKPMKNSDRYGVVEISQEQNIVSFKEKNYYENSLINGGVYAINTESFLREPLPEKFSFEKDYLEALFTKRKMYGFIQDEYFIDIGIPEDYQKANIDFKDAGPFSGR
jgi:D-glycero-alpha-D-manno-heptose 1-phosphate guanylyltransferase